MKSSGIGGQAVMEGIMMRNGEKYAVGVRKPDQEIFVKIEEYKAPAKRPAITRVPFIRGVFNFVDSLYIGMKTLTYSASFYEEEEPKKDKKAEDSKDAEVKVETAETKAEEAADAVTTIEPPKPPVVKEEPKKEGGMDAGTWFAVLLSIVISVALFMVLPVFLGNLVAKATNSSFWVAFAEGVIRLAIFIAYVALISLMPDIRRVYMYHGGEHKCINCVEHGLPLTVENVRKSSRFHKRCGTSFLLIVMMISIVLFMIIRVRTLWLRVLSRILLLPVIAGISYEFLRLAGNSDNAFVSLLSKPGLALQHLTTREPDDDMIEVGIASVEAVFSWKKYLNENFGMNYDLSESEAAAGEAEALEGAEAENVPTDGESPEEES
ncbi:MAG: DUF1385 domain-containing protein [Lachnospiraceae bacterium]|nr:DUF1385 domain-containing protein [Lachnospiraceae bacterium]